MRTFSLLLSVVSLVACATIPVPAPPRDTETRVLPTGAREQAVQAELDNLAKAVEALESQGQFVTDPITLSEILKDPEQQEGTVADVRALSAFTRDVLMLSDRLILAIKSLPGSRYGLVAQEDLHQLLHRIRRQIAAIDASAENLGLPRTLPQVPRSLIPI